MVSGMLGAMRREGKGKFLNHLNKFTVGTVVVVVIVTRTFQLQLLDTLLIETDGVVKDLALENESVEFIAISLGKEKFCREYRIRTF